jgi:hypothetical protein
MQIDPAEYPEWNSLVEAHPESCCLHSLEWTKVLTETYGYRTAFLLSQAEGQLAAVVPFLDVRTILGARKGVSLPFSDLCGPLVWEPADRNALWNHIIQHAARLSWRSVEIRGGVALADCPASLSYLGHVVRLDCSQATLFDRLDPAVRRAVRKAQRLGVRIEMSDSWAAVEDYFRLHCLTRKRHGLPPQPLRLFRKIHEHLISKGMGFVATAIHSNRPIAAAVFFKLGRKSLFKFGASDSSFQSMRANNLVMWEGIKKLSNEGGDTLHLGRTSAANRGLRHFKLGWGAEEQPIAYTVFDLRRSMFVPGTDRAYGWHNWFFKMVPSWMARTVGSILYGQLA